MDSDIRWKQRLESYKMAFNRFENTVIEVTSPSDLEKEGSIQRFEFTHELACKALKSTSKKDTTITTVHETSLIIFGYCSGRRSSAYWL